MVLLRQGLDYNVEHRVPLPQFHEDSIRQLAVCPTDVRHVASCGDDGRAFITNVERVVQSIQARCSVGSNVLYQATQPLGSIAWCPTGVILFELYSQL